MRDPPSLLGVGGGGQAGGWVSWSSGRPKMTPPPVGKQRSGQVSTTDFSIFPEKPSLVHAAPSAILGTNTLFLDISAHHFCMFPWSIQKFPAAFSPIRKSAHFEYSVPVMV